MDKIILEIENKFELLALQRTLLEAKFHPNPHYLPECQGSPLVANVSNKIFDLIIELYRKAGDEKNVQEQEKWRYLNEKSSQVELLVMRIREADGWWKTANRDTKVQFIYNFLAPFILSEEIIEKIAEM